MIQRLNDIEEIPNEQSMSDDPLADLWKETIVFRDQSDRPCVASKIGTKPSDIYYLREKRIHHVAFHEFKKAKGYGACRKKIGTYIESLESEAIADGEVKTVFNRIGGNGLDKMYVNLANDSRQAVEIDSEGWRIVPLSSEVLFRSPKSMKPLLPPERTNEKLEDLLSPFIRVPSLDDLKSLIGWLINAVFHTGPYPVLVLQGGQGTSKSTISKVLKRLIDPSMTEIMTLPRSERDLMVVANSNWLLAFDNLSAISDSMSDAFCRLATGGGFSGRKLYTDGDEHYIYVQRPVILNGIDDLLKRADLAERSITINLEPIPESDRKAEDTFWAEFEEKRPKILGSLYNAVSYSLSHLDELEPSNLPRMADFFKRVSAAEASLGWENGSFRTAYEASLKAGDDQVRDCDVVVRCIDTFISKIANSTWEGSATELLEQLEEIAKKRGVRKELPRSPNALSRSINSRKKLLNELNIEVTENRTAAKKIITIKK